MTTMLAHSAPPLACLREREGHRQSDQSHSGEGHQTRRG
jgi:hypothetical protein